jgi:long chain fatty acid CoA FadD26
MPVLESSISASLRERAAQQPDATAFTYMNYDDWAGRPESLTWSGLYRRT